MVKITKTWKIGEYAKGGIITVQIVGKVISAIGKEWDMSKGTSKKSNQSGAKEWTRGTVLFNDRDAYIKLYDFLSNITTHYYADTIMKWIETKGTFTQNSW